MEKIKQALHIHDKTEVPGDGAVGNMQNPSSSEGGPTSTELWGSGNGEAKYRHSGDTVAAAAAEVSSKRHNYSQPAPRPDDAFSAAQQAQTQTPSSSGRGDETAIVAAEFRQGSALPQEEKNLSPIDDPKLARSIDPFRNEPEPSAETGPGSHFRSDTVSSAATQRPPPDQRS